MLAVAKFVPNLFGPLRWSSSQALIVPSSDGEHELVSVKDPTVVHFDGRWHVYASTVTSKGAYSMAYLSFEDFAEAGSATFYPMRRTPGFEGYTAAPQLFYFAPQAKWYLVFQSGPPMYSTNDEPGDPTRWTRPAPFFASQPATIGDATGWLDFWVICDDRHAYLFFTDDHGAFYRSKTRIEQFPNGFDEPVVFLREAEAGRLYEGCCVYAIAGHQRYLALVEAFDASSNGRRYYRSFLAESLDGAWTPLHGDAGEPFVGLGNVEFEAIAWTHDISHGELIRAGHDQTLTIQPSRMRFLYQGVEHSADQGKYNSIPWKLALLSERA